MQFRITIFMMATLAFAAFTACGGGRKAVGDACDEIENRGCLRQGVDCDIVGSTNFDKLVVASGCSSQLDDLEDCLGDFDDICEETCGSEGDALGACLIDYCNVNQDPLCNLGTSQ